MSDATEETAPAEEVPETAAEAPAQDAGTEETEAPDEAPVPDGGAAPAAEAGSEGGQPEEDAGGPAEDEVEASGDGDSSSPQVVNDGNGQHVVMPDGTVVVTRNHTYPVSNAEQAVYEETHSGDQLRYPWKPGDQEYSSYSDPSVPNSQASRWIETEIASYAERVLLDPDAKVSPIWEGLQPTYKSEIEDAIETGGGEGKVRA
jgi:hypothetical protein